jgi:hypothetical protein
MQPTKQQQNRLLKLAKVADTGEVGLVELLFELEDKIDSLPEIAKGDKGDKGNPGRDGVDGQDGNNGTDGKDGRDGRDGRDGEQGIEGKPGKDGTDGKDGLNGENFDPKITDEINKKIKELKQLIELNVSRNNIESLPITTTNFFANGALVGRAKNINFTGTFPDIKIVGDVANVNLDSSDSTGINIGTPVGTVDGSNTTFTVTHTPVAVIVDGMYRVAGFGYTYSAGTITVDPLAPPVQFIRYLY